MEYKQLEALTIILKKLDSGGRVTISSLMEDLVIKERTAYRYLHILRDAGGFPIEFDKKLGRYVFAEGFALKQLKLTVKESLAFALAKKMLAGFGTDMESIFTNLEKRLTADSSKLPSHILIASGTHSGKTMEYIGVISDAIMNYQKIQIDYSASHSNDTGLRKLKPYFLFYRDGFWYMRAYCEKVSDIRTFAIDGIKSLKVLNEAFLPKDINANEELDASFGAWMDGELVDVVLLFDKTIKAGVLSKKWHKSQVTKELRDGKLEIRFTVKGLGGIKKWLYQWLPHVEVIAPKELKAVVANDLSNALDKNRIKTRQ